MTIPVAAVGASAGGLEAFNLLLAHLPATTGLAFVFVQHLDPKHQSNLTEILARATAMPVRQVIDGMEIEANHIYVIPPDAALDIAGGTLRVTPRLPITSGPHMPIDHFLCSLARECGSRAIGVILSGAGTDGVVGLEAVKAAAGMTFAQDPTTAKFDSMPRAAIGSGCIDFVLSPEAIAGELTKLGNHPYIADGEDTGLLGPAAAEKDQFDPIVELLRKATGIDFGLYRENTIYRRIWRRLALRNMGSLEEYRRQIEHDPHELSALHRDLLISVTRFFRDPEAFESLKRFVFPHLMQARLADAPIRIWVAGCATGEEAYSIAISLQEEFEKRGHVYPVQIFASDISSAAIERARSGRYGETMAADISPERLNRYFSKVEGGYQVSKALREMCVFSRHDLIQDPPFSKLDLISCRNVLIFFGSVRKNVITLFHYALNRGGFLVLGPSETESGNLFSPVSGAHSIYTKSATVGRQAHLYAGTTGPRRSTDAYDRLPGIRAGQPASSSDLRKELERTLLSKYSGTGVVVDDSLDVLEILGQTAPFLTLPSGKVSLNLLKLLPDARVFLEVENLVREVKKSGETARKERVPYQNGTSGGELNIEIVPLSGMRTRALLVLFEPAPGVSGIEPDLNSEPRDREIARLKRDLADARRRLLSIIEEHESSQQENQNTAEEAVSANEELQSLNEELETAKEELQSTNEELTTVNEELRSKNAAVIEARDFAMSIVATASAPLLVLDTDLRVRSANPAFYRVFRMSPLEAQGHLLYSLANGCWDIPRLRDLLQSILPDHKVVEGFQIEHSFPVIGRRVLLINARQLDGGQEILLGIDDVTERQARADATLRESEDRFQNMADAAPVMIWVSGQDKGCTFFNKGWLDFTGRTLQQELGSGWTEDLHPQDLDRCLEVYSSSFDARRSFQLESRVRRADGEYRWLLTNGTPRVEPGGTFAGYIGSCLDITELKRTHEEHLAKLKLETVGTLAAGIAHDFNNLLGGVLAHSELALTDLTAGLSPAVELRAIRSLAVRGAEIVRQLMIYAGGETNIIELVDVSGIVEDILELIKVSVSKYVVMKIDLGGNLPAVRANPAQIRQVVMNLVTNASEAIGNHDGVVRVSTGKVTIGRDAPVAAAENLAKGDYLRLEVSDTGRGIAPEMQAKVFDPFFTTKSAGHGLGLAVVQGIVRGLHGTIRLLSAPGKDTTIQILLPCEANSVQSSHNPLSRPGEAALLSRKATILVVEDEGPLRQALAKMFHQKGLSVIEANDGSTALDLIRAEEKQIDVLLLDIGLPGASSREVFEEARRIRPDLGIIVTSAYNQETAAASLGGPVDRFIRKPFRLSDLIDMIRDILSS